MLRPASGANSSVPSPAHSNALLKVPPGSYALQRAVMLTDSILIEGTVTMWALLLSRSAQRFCFSTLVSVLVSFNCQLGTVKNQEGRGNLS